MKLFKAIARYSLSSTGHTAERWEAERAGQGSHGHPMSAYLKAFLVRINEGIIYTSRLRAFLIKHPLLIIELGFHLKLDYNARYGFDYAKTIPTEVWLRTKLRTLDQNLLTSTCL